MSERAFYRALDGKFANSPPSVRVVDGKPSFAVDNGEAVAASLVEYCEELNKGKLAEIWNPYARRKAKLVRGKLVARSTNEKNQVTYNGVCFGFESNHTLLVGFQKPEDAPLWFGCIGFIAGNKLHRYSFERRETFGASSAVVVQIQAPLKEKGENSLAILENSRQFFQLYQTPSALLALAIDWAKTNKLDSLYVLPANKNSYFIPGTERAERLVKRYDQTARGMGFTVGKRGFHQLLLR